MTFFFCSFGGGRSERREDQKERTKKERKKGEK